MRYFTIIVSEPQLGALDAAADTCIDQWDGSEPDDLAQQDALRAAKVALNSAEEVR